MRILYLTNSIPSPDCITGTYNLNRANHLVRKGIELKIVKFNNIIDSGGIKWRRNYYMNDVDWDSKKFQSLIQNEVAFINYLKIPKFEFYLSLYNKAYSIYKDFNAALIHTHIADQGFIAHELKKKYSIPYVITAHGSEIHTNPYIFKGLKERIVKILENANSVIFVSDYLKQQAIKLGYSAKNAIVIPNGISTDIFKTNNSKQKIKTKAVGYIGNLTDLKRTKWLPQIFKIIQDKLDDVKFFVIGTGPNKNYIIEKCNELNIKNIEILGEIHQDKIPEYLAKINVLLLMSKKEGWPCIVLEANSCGAYVVGSNNGGIPEAIGELGSIIDDIDNDEETIQSFANITIDILGKNINSVALINRANQFDWSNIIDKEIEVYKEVLKR